MFVQFQSSPVPKDGCNGMLGELDIAKLLVSILTRPEGRVQRGNEMATIRVPDVSILTRPEGRVQRSPRRRRWRHRRVSILTRPEGRVQRVAARAVLLCREFQSSPVPKDGCNQRRQVIARRECTFQSSPVPKDGCNCASTSNPT